MTAKSIPLLLIFALFCIALTGCQDDAVSRKPSAPEIEKANESRLEYINSLNISEEQKQAMRDRIAAPKSDTGENRGN